MRIYVASLSDYNNGLLHGAWIDLEGQDIETVWYNVKKMLRASKCPNVQVDCPICDGTGEAQTDPVSPCEHCKETGKVPSAEEWAIHDYEMEGIKIGESESFEKCLDISEAFEEHGEKFLMAYANFSDVSEAVSACEESYQGCFRTLEDWAESFAEETGMLDSIPENLRGYFDFEKYARDCELGGDIWTAEGSEGLHIFTNN
jgi:antirestriction protein